MNAPATFPETTLDDAAESHAAWAEGVLKRQIARIEVLADAALELAVSIKDTAGEPESYEGASRAFNRAARAVRLCGLLQSRLLQDLQRIRSWDDMQSVSARGAAEAAAALRKAKEDPAYAHKAKVEAVVARVAKAKTEDEEELDRLVAECGERLDDDDIYGDVRTRPVGELVALICRDLDLEPNWPRLAEEVWAQAEAAAGDPRSPFYPPPLAGEVGRRLGGGESLVHDTPPQSLRDSSPASGGASSGRASFFDGPS